MRLSTRLPIAIPATAQGEDSSGNPFAESVTVLNISDVGALVVIRDLHGVKSLSLQFPVPSDLPNALNCVQCVTARVVRVVSKDGYILAGVQFGQPLSSLIRSS